jgi:hypothetical protein
MHPAVTADGGGQVSGEALAAARVRCDPEVFTEVYDRYFRVIYLYVGPGWARGRPRTSQPRRLVWHLASVTGSTLPGVVCAPGCSGSPPIWSPGTGGQRLVTTGH